MNFNIIFKIERSTLQKLMESRIEAAITPIVEDALDGTSIIARPSGTEPKIKVYILTKGADKAQCAANLEKYGQWVASLQK